MKTAEKYFNAEENLQPGLADKFVHGAIPTDNWDEFIKFMAPYFEEYASQPPSEIADEIINHASDQDDDKMEMG